MVTSYFLPFLPAPSLPPQALYLIGDDIRMNSDSIEQTRWNISHLPLDALKMNHAYLLAVDGEKFCPSRCLTPEISNKLKQE